MSISDGATPRLVTINAARSNDRTQDSTVECLVIQTIVGNTPTIAILTGRGLLDDESIDQLNFDDEELRDGFRSNSFDDVLSLQDAMSSIVNTIRSDSDASLNINALRTPDLTDNEPISVRENGTRMPTPASTPNVPDFCDVNVSPAASDDLVRKTAAVLTEHAHLFGGSRRPGTHQSPPMSKCEPFSLTLIPNSDLTQLRSREGRFGPEQEAAIRAQIDAWLPDIIEPSNAVFSSRPLAVRKKDGSWRICVDYRAVNKTTLGHQYPLPRVEEVLSKLAKIGTRFSSFDGWSMFQSLPIADELTKDLSSFKACGRLWRFLRCPFGWQSLPSHLQRFMDTAFSDDARFVPYADDLSIAHPTDTDDTLVGDLGEVMRRANINGITFRADKTHLFYYSLDALGHRVSAGSINPPHDRIDALLNIGKPDTRAELRRLLHVAQHWSPFIPMFARIASPLWDLSRGDTTLVWNDEATSAFEWLHAALRSPAIVAPFDSIRPVILRTDFSQSAICWIVLQEYDGKERIVHCGGRRCESYETRYAPQVGELLALHEAVRACPQYLTGLPNPFAWHSDNKPMVDTNRSPSGLPSANATITRWLLELQTVPFSAVHVPGKSPAQSLQDYISRIRVWNVATTPPAADPRDAPSSDSRPPSTTRLFDRLVLLDEFASQPDPQRSVLTWLRSLIPATATAARAVFPDSTQATPSFAPITRSTTTITTSSADVSTTSHPATFLVPDLIQQHAASGAPLASPITALPQQQPAMLPPAAVPIVQPAAAGQPPIAGTASEPLATLDETLRSNAWKQSVAADPALATLITHAERDRQQRQHVPAAFYDTLGLLRVLDRNERRRNRRRVADRNRSYIVVPTDRRREIFAAYHDGSFGGHFSASTSYRSARELFHWDGMHSDFEQWYRACPTCTAARAHSAQGGAGEYGADAGKFECVAIDCIKQPTDHEGYDHIVVTVDHCTRAFEAVAIRGCTAETFERTWLFRYGCPRLLLSDNGPEFQGDPWTRLKNGYGFAHPTIAPHNPRANGIAERLNRDIKARLTRAGQPDGLDWRPHLDAAAAALRMTIGDRGVSIFELLHGQKPLLPAAARLGTDAHVRRLHAPTEEELAKRTHNTVSQLIALVQTRRAERQHASAVRIRAAEFHIGDVVSIQNLDDKQTKFAALRRWPGPLIIVSRAPWSQSGEYEAFQLQRPDGSHISMFVPARFLRRWEGDPFPPSPAAVAAEPGARSWEGILDRSVLDRQHLARSTKADARAAAELSNADSLADRIRADEDRFVARIIAARDNIDRQRARSEQQQYDNDTVQLRINDLRQRNIDVRFADDLQDFNTQLALYDLIQNNVPLSTSTRGFKIYSTIPSPYTASSILRQIRLDQQLHYIVQLNDNSNIIVIPDALTVDFRRQFEQSQRARRAS